MSPPFAQPARGDRAFERLYRRHAADVYRYAYAVLQNRSDAEDVVQTTFMNAYRALERGEQPARPHNWLIAIAHNVCRQRFRQSQRRPSEVEWQDDLPDQLVADDERPTAEDVRRALGYLPFAQRAALVMRELEGRSYAEIGEVLELSTSAVETLIFRARRALREQLEGSLTCGEAELAISRQLDGRLSRAEKGQLRAHLRECPECATFARRQRAQRSALRSLGAIPLPASLASLFGGGGATGAGAGVSAIAAKTIAVAAAAALAGGAGYEVVKSSDQPARSRRPRPHLAAPATVAVVAPPRIAPVVVVPDRPAAHRHRQVSPATDRRHGHHHRPAVEHGRRVHGHGHAHGAVHPPARPAPPAPVVHTAGRSGGRSHAPPARRARGQGQSGRAATTHGRSTSHEHAPAAEPPAHRAAGNGPPGAAPPTNGPPAQAPPDPSPGPPAGHGASFSR